MLDVPLFLNFCIGHSCLRSPNINKDSAGYFILLLERILILEGETGDAGFAFIDKDGVTNASDMTSI